MAVLGAKPPRWSGVYVIPGPAEPPPGRRGPDLVRGPARPKHRGGFFYLEMILTAYVLRCNINLFVCLCVERRGQEEGGGGGGGA